MTAQQNISRLPAYCFDRLLSTNEVIGIRAGESGYFPCPLPPNAVNKAKGMRKEDIEVFVNEENKRIGVDFATRMAMSNGSLWGWDIPASRPEFWREHFRQHPKVAQSEEIQQWQH